MTGVLFVLPLMFQQVLRLTPLETGVAFLPMTVPFAVNPLVTGRIVARFGPRPPILAGLAAGRRRARARRRGDVTGPYAGMGALVSVDSVTGGGRLATALTVSAVACGAAVPGVARRR